MLIADIMQHLVPLSDTMDRLMPYLKDFPKVDPNGLDSPLTNAPKSFVFDRAIGPVGLRRYNTPMRPDDMFRAQQYRLQPMNFPVIRSGFDDSKGVVDSLRNP